MAHDHGGVEVYHNKGKTGFETSKTISIYGGKIFTHNFIFTRMLVITIDIIRMNLCFNILHFLFHLPPAHIQLQSKKTGFETSKTISMYGGKEFIHNMNFIP